MLTMHAVFHSQKLLVRLWTSPSRLELLCPGSCEWLASCEVSFSKGPIPDYYDYGPIPKALVAASGWASSFAQIGGHNLEMVALRMELRGCSNCSTDIPIICKCRASI